MTREVRSEGSDRARRTDTPRVSRAVEARSTEPGVAAPAQAGVIGLQRAAGNRAVLRLLSRWAAHPDKDKKGQFMTDQMAADWDRFNPPLSK